MNIAGINYESVNDGDGVRTVIYVSGCHWKCLKCHNSDAQDINYGIPFTYELFDEIIDNIEKRPFVTGITLSGGDPLNDNNVIDVLNFVVKFKRKFPDKTIWLYTGYTWEQIRHPINMKDFNPYREKILYFCDVLVDGKYIDRLRDVTLKFCGSSNQRVIDVQKSLKENKTVLYN